MPRQWYRPTPADFVIAQGAEAEIYGPGVLPEDPPVGTGTFGSAVLLTKVAAQYDVFLDAALSVQTTDLLDAAGAEIDWIEQETDFVNRGTLQAFQGPDNFTGPVYLSADGVTGYRIEPDSTELYARMTAAEAAKATADLSDWSTTAPTDGQIPVFNSGTGDWTPQAAGSPASMPVVVVWNGVAWPTRASVIGLAPFVWWIDPTGTAPDPADAASIDIIDRIIP